MKELIETLELFLEAVTCVDHDLSIIKLPNTPAYRALQVQTYLYKTLLTDVLSEHNEIENPPPAVIKLVKKDISLDQMRKEIMDIIKDDPDRLIVSVNTLLEKDFNCQLSKDLPPSKRNEFVEAVKALMKKEAGRKITT